MDEAEARSRLEQMIAWDAVPKLTADEVTDVLAWGRRADDDGRYPTDSDWSGRWDLHAAAAEGWRRKAGKCAGSFDFGSDGQSFSRSQMHAMCLEMSANYRRGILVSVPITPAAAGMETVIVEAGAFGTEGGTFGGL